MTSTNRTAINDTLHSLESARRKEDWLECQILAYNLCQLFREALVNDVEFQFTKPYNIDEWLNPRSVIPF